MSKDMIQFWTEINPVEKLEFAALAGSVTFGIILTYIEKVTPVKPVKGMAVKSKLDDLALDSELSKGYLQKLINGTKKKEDFAPIVDYLKDPAKTKNLSQTELNFLLKLIMERFKLISEKGLMDSLIEKTIKGATSMAEVLFV